MSPPPLSNNFWRMTRRGNCMPLGSIGQVSGSISQNQAPREERSEATGRSCGVHSTLLYLAYLAEQDILHCTAVVHSH